MKIGKISFALIVGLIIMGNSILTFADTINYVKDIEVKEQKKTSYDYKDNITSHSSTT